MSTLRLLSVSIATGAVVGLLAIGAMIMAGVGQSSGDDTPVLNLAEDDGFLAPRISPPLEKPGMTLVRETGEPWNLREETDGEVTLLYVGYTNCPDICPTHLANIAAALDRVPGDVGREVTVVFATSDPQRDTPQVLDNYLDRFNPDFIGLTGSLEEMEQFQRAINMEPAEFEGDTESGDYEVAHASYVIAYGEDNRGRIVFPDTVTLDDWEHDLEKLVLEGVPAN